MFLDDGRMPENVDRTHTVTSRKCKLHTKRSEAKNQTHSLLAVYFQILFFLSKGPLSDLFVTVFFLHLRCAHVCLCVCMCAWVCMWEKNSPVLLSDRVTVHFSHDIRSFFFFKIYCSCRFCCLTPWQLINSESSWPHITLPQIFI